MQIKVKDGYLIGYARIGGFPDGIEVDAALIEAIDPQKLYCYRYENGVLTLDEEKWSAEQQAADRTPWKRSPEWRWRHWRRRTTTRVSGPPVCTRTGRPARMRLGTSATRAGRRGSASRRTITRFIRTSGPGMQRGTPSGVRCTGKAREPPARSSRCRVHMTSTAPESTWYGRTVGFTVACRIRISRLTSTHRRGKRKEQHENQDTRNLHITGNRNRTFVIIDSIIDGIYTVVIFTMPLDGAVIGC